MTEKPLILSASARKQSETKAFLNTVFTGMDHEVIDLPDFQIAPYDYSNNYPAEDDFLQIADAMVKHQVLVFATPVYWYAMSGVMKTFFDRFTDLVTTQKHLGRRLKGKTTLLLAVGADAELPDGFEIPFQYTSHYLNMTYSGCIYHSTKFPKAENNFRETIESFKDKLVKFS